MFSTSTRNFPNSLGRIPTKAEYMEGVGVLDASSAEIHRYMNLDQIEDYRVDETTAA